jgi:cell volume regulation protein A
LAVVTFGIILANNDPIRSAFSKNKYIRKIFALKEWKMSGQIQTFHSEVTFFIKTFMFVTLGVLITSNILSLRSLLFSALFISMIYLVRFLIFLFMKFKDKSYLIAIVPRGLTQAVVALYVVAHYATSAMNSLVSIVVTVIIATNIVSSCYLFIKRNVKL